MKKSCPMKKKKAMGKKKAAGAKKSRRMANQKPKGRPQY